MMLEVREKGIGGKPKRGGKKKPTGIIPQSANSRIKSTIASFVSFTPLKSTL
jgi:hypothetical protein